MSSWPRNRGKPGPLDAFRDSGETKIICGLGGCAVSYSGPFGEVKPKLDGHREKDHPDFVPSDPRKREKKRRKRK